MSGHRDLRAVAAGAVLCAVVVIAVPVDGIRTVAGLPLALVLPGFAITAAAFARQRLELAQKVVLSVGLSLATLAVSTLPLNYGPGGLRAAPWAVFLAAVVLAGCVIAGRRRPSEQGGGPRARLRLRPRPLEAVLLLGALLSVVAAVVLSQTAVPAKNVIGYTQLWMLPTGGHGTAVRIGVASQEQDPHTYSLELRYDGRHRPVSSGFSLQPGQGRGFELPVRSQFHREARVTALLYRSDHPGVPYRRVTAWVAGSRPRP